MEITERQASDLRWEQAEYVVEALAAGMPQQKLANHWRRPDGTSYSREHVEMVKRTWQTFDTLSIKPRWNEAYNSPEVRQQAL